MNSISGAISSCQVQLNGKQLDLIFENNRWLRELELGRNINSLEILAIANGFPGSKGQLKITINNQIAIKENMKIIENHAIYYQSNIPFLD